MRTPFVSRKFTLLPLITALLSIAPALAQGPPPSIPATLIDEKSAPKIDGIPNEPIWQKAKPITKLTQVDPLQLGKPTEATTIRILYTSKKLYIAVQCFDSSPSTIIAKQMLRDESISDDRLTIMIDTFKDRRNGYFFQIGAAGARRDGLIENNRSPNSDWDGLWVAKTSRNKDGWTVEFAIPFATIPFNPSSTQWGVNFERRLRRTNERIRWANPYQNLSVETPAAGGTLTNLNNLQQGLGITIKPFATTDFDLADSGTNFKAGTDIFYRLTPSITAALTVNTDFAETEVDQQRVNLTRFPLFFPEKRDFFLEDAGVFGFGGLNRTPLPFFSRRIGIVDGDEKEILAGAKITGRHNDLRFGLMSILMKDDSELGQKTLSVLRASLDVLEESSLGFILTNGDPAHRGDNTLVGFDFNFRSSDDNGKVYKANFWSQFTHTTREDESFDNSENYAIGGRIDYPNEPWFFFFFTSHVGENYNPALGFVSRTGSRRYLFESRYRHRPNDKDNPLRYIDFEAEIDIITTLHNEIESAEIAPELDIFTNSNDRLRIKIFFTREQLFEPFEIVDDVTIPVGIYNNTGISLDFNSSPSRPLALEFDIAYYGFFSGKRLDIETELAYRPSKHNAFRIEYERNDIQLKEGDFVVHILRLRYDLLITPDLTWSTTIQWDNQSDQMGANSRIRWEFDSGQEFFIVLNDTYDTNDGRFKNLSRQLKFKVGLTLQF